MNPGSQGEPTLCPPPAASYLPPGASRRLLQGLYSSGEGTSSTLLVEGQGWAERGEGWSVEDFPKEASPGRRGEEGRDLGQERLGFQSDYCFFPNQSVTH